jgi:anti-sigma regulatory factor (Ser/Thr protein kinase)
MTALTHTVCPPTCIPFQRRYPAHPASVSRARHAIADAARHGLDADSPDLIDSINLLASELISNAVTHTGSEPDDLIEVTLWISDHHLWLAVADNAPDQPTLRAPGDDATGGRGLLLVTAIAAAWGVLPRATGTGKVVFAGLALLRD